MDHSRFGGPVYLDGTRWGLPLSRLIDGDGMPDSLMPILRVLPARVLGVFGARVARVPGGCLYVLRQA
ncbi:hypothetical protein [Streptomyces prasinus]|uniref:hypothetical protein n=1 Tax=Streptomyces prasinus TaxID=67345 RepID=UPI0036BDA77F